MIEKVWAVVMAGVFALCLGCRQQDMPAMEKGDSGSARKVLIAAADSEFKRGVINKIIEKLGTGEYYFKIVGLDGLEGGDTGSYGAVVLVNAFMAGRMDERAARFLQEHPGDPKVIVFYTRGTDDPVPDRFKPELKVDAVTSSSLAGNAGPDADRIAALIKKRF